MQLQFTRVAGRSRFISHSDMIGDTQQNTVKRERTPQPFPYSKVHGANMGPIWGRQDPGGPHVGHMKIVIRVWILIVRNHQLNSNNNNNGPLWGESIGWFPHKGQVIQKAFPRLGANGNDIHFCLIWFWLCDGNLELKEGQYHCE